MASWVHVCSGAVPVITSRVFRSKERAPPWPCLVALTSLTMILPNLAATDLGPLYNKPQLAFAGLVSLVLYCSFVFIQTVRHRDYFLPIQSDNPEAHAPPPGGKTTVLSAGLLVVSLIAIVGLAATAIKPVNMSKHTEIRRALDAKNPKNGYGVELADNKWYYYDNWIEKVAEHCKEGDEAHR
jgi:hypothetical protein